MLPHEIQEILSAHGIQYFEFSQTEASYTIYTRVEVSKDAQMHIKAVSHPKEVRFERAKDNISEALKKHKPVDNVNHPPHYTMGKIEVIDAIEDWKLNYHRGSVIKYTARAGRKDPAKEIEDLKKAQWYLNREIERLEK